jgi:zinc transport system substrate-binding protein
MPKAAKFLLVLLCALSTTAVQSAPKVVASIKPLQLIAGAITEGVSAPELLIPASQSYHHYTLRPSSVRTLNGADLLIWVGPELETFLASALQQAERDKAVVRVMTLPQLTLHPINEPDRSEEPGPENHSHLHGQSDPHVWLDTGNALKIAEAVTQQLRAMDPANAGQYLSNLQRFSDRLKQAQLSVSQMLQPLRGEAYAVYHNSVQYFEQENGLSHVIVLVAGDEIQPGVRQLLAVRESLQLHAPVCLFEDVTTSAATVTTALGNYTLRRQRLDLLGEALVPGPDAYPQLIEKLAEDFLRCLSGPE